MWVRPWPVGSGATLNKGEVIHNILWAGAWHNLLLQYNITSVNKKKQVINLKLHDLVYLILGKRTLPTEVLISFFLCLGIG